MKQVNGLQSDRDLRQIVVQNDKISLSDIAPERGCSCIKKGRPYISSHIYLMV